MALKLWSKFENAGDVTSPQMGTGGAEVGSPTYVPAKFNNGILSDVDNEGCTLPTAANLINLDKGTIEFWAKLNFDELDGDNHFFLDFYATSYGGLRLFFSSGDYDFRVFVWSGGNVKVNLVTVGMAWDIGDLLHFGLTWDRQGNDIGGGKTVALYIDNVEKASSTTTWDTDTVNPNLYIGLEKGGTMHSDAVIDNLKTQDVVKTDFSDKEDEDADGNQPPTPPTSLEVDGKSDPTGANCISSANPKFTAIFNDPDVGDQSNAIEIQVGTEEGLSDMWDSGWIADSTAEGNRCAAKTYDGAALSGGTSYWWRCRFRDDENAEGAWSAWQQFDMCAVARNLTQMCLI